MARPKALWLRPPREGDDVATLFPKWMNHLPTMAAVGGVFGATAVVCGFWYYATPKFWRVGYQPTQPGGGFNHQIHAGQLGLDCLYCHTKVTSSSEANIPNVATCYGCHRDGALKKLMDPTVEGQADHKAKTEFIRAAYAVDSSLEWERVHKLPDYVRNFPHDAHLAAGVSCYSCHGRIDQMPVVYHAQPLSMSWCLDCHREPELAVLDDKSKVTDLAYAERTLAERSSGNAAALNAQKLIEDAHVNAPENCGACHY